MNTLPFELQLEIIQDLGLKELLILYQTNKAFQTLLNRKDILNLLYRKHHFHLTRQHHSFLSLFREYQTNWWKMYNDV